MRYLAYTIALGVAVCGSRADAQTLQTLVQFTGTGGTASGQGPLGSLTLVGTSLYGMTRFGGANGYGNIFSVGENGTNYQNLVSFTGTSGTATGREPFGSLTLVGTTLFGTTIQGGANGDGSVFSMGVDGTNYQSLLSFTGTGGAAIGQGAGGDLTPVGAALYGMTTQGGVNGDGNIYSVGVDGTNYHNVLSFTGTGGAASGQYPSGCLTLVGTTLYGTTQTGGAKGHGNVFSVGLDGSGYRNLVSFTGSSGTAIGDEPTGSLTLVGTRLYGMTAQGLGFGTAFSVGTDGTGIQNLQMFGSSPRGSLTLGGTTLYGMTENGGPKGTGAEPGNIFSVGLSGSGYRDLYDFTGGVDGGYPNGDLLLSGGTLFGMTAGGGVNNNGTIFAFTGAVPMPEPGTMGLITVGAAALVSHRWGKMRRSLARARR